MNDSDFQRLWGNIDVEGIFSESEGASGVSQPCGTEKFSKQSIPLFISICFSLLNIYSPVVSLALEDYGRNSFSSNNLVIYLGALGSFK